MGLWGSKQKRELEIPNEPIGVSVDALNAILDAAEAPKAQATLANTQTPPPAPVDLHLSAELHDKRLLAYERGMIESLDSSSKYVEGLFRERYRTAAVCGELQASVSACYAQHPRATLNCLDIANKFIKCVEDERKARLVV